MANIKVLLKIHQEPWKRPTVTNDNLMVPSLKADFTDWSQGKDPDDIGWQYDAESKLFHPVK